MAYEINMHSHYHTEGDTRALALNFIRYWKFVLTLQKIRSGAPLPPHLHQFHWGLTISLGTRDLLEPRWLHY